MAQTPTGARTPPRLTHRAAVLGLVLLVLVVSYASSLRAWLDQRQQIAQTQTESATAHDDVAALEQELRRWADDVYVEQQARERLAYVMPGETGYRVITEGGEPLGAQPEPGEEPASGLDRAWYDTLWSSSQRAGRQR